jgi:hypothetical protein
MASETVNSMIKRLLDAALRARKYWSQSRETILRVLTHNMILRTWVFYRAVQMRFRGEFAAAALAAAGAFGSGFRLPVYSRYSGHSRSKMRRIAARWAVA